MPHMRDSGPARPGLAAALILAVLASAPALAQSGSSQDPAAGTSKTEPAKPTGGGPTSGEAAPQPPAEQTVILPSASGHTNSAAPTMHRNCDPAPSKIQGAPDNSTDPCRKPAEPGDTQTMPPMSK